MGVLTDASRFTGGDAFYAALVERLDAAGPEGATAYLGRLALILANEIGDGEILAAALEAARKPDAA